MILINQRFKSNYMELLDTEFYKVITIVGDWIVSVEDLNEHCLINIDHEYKQPINGYKEILNAMIKHGASKALSIKGYEDELENMQNLGDGFYKYKHGVIVY